MISLTTSTKIISLCTILVFYFYDCSAKDNITTGEFISDGSDHLESSPEKKFQMGFFPHEKTSELRRYVGIWYTMDPKTIVWVANRDNPVMDSTGVLMVAEDGHVKIVSKDITVNISTTTEGGSRRALKLLDNGNAVLIDVASRNILWESFKNPTDTFLPGMMMMAAGIKLKSWKSLEDPGSGRFVFELDIDNRYSILSGSTKQIWKSGSRSEDSFDENQILPKVSNLLSNTTLVRLAIANNCTHSVKEFYRTCVNKTNMVIEPYSRLVMSYSGKIQFFRWLEKKNQWVLDWQEPKDNCSIYRVCGSFGMCNENKSPLCSCMDGFEPISDDNNPAGCKRISEIDQKNTKDTFVNKTMISMDDTTMPFVPSVKESVCIEECLENNQCLAYSYTSQNKEGTWDKLSEVKQGCWFWNSEPNNLKENGTHNISFRISGSFKEPSINTSSENPKPERKSSFSKQVLALAIVGSVLVLSSFCGICYISYKRLVNKKNSHHNIESQSNNTWSRINELLHLDHSKEDDSEGINVPYFELESIVAATNDFSENNLLGRGGFGPVYKGTLPGGQEIAVKRLSSLSGQGLREFKNEVILIAKLQHRNLVRLMGYCTKGDEKMLLYEYLPNRSLDLFIFDQTLCSLLDWEMRFKIILGIARGLNYLHHDSRLKIIHRDLKTSNILLDENMNSKISDFGLAKIVKGKDLEDITNRIVGTFGYMSPEYALDGMFSIKSDVFSFGVVMLEIVSGKKNTGFNQSQKRISLLGYAWSLWIEDKPLELIDQIAMKSCNSSEVLKCIIVGLLCVQGDPDDRPTMAKALLMLGGDIATLPTPKDPTFISRRDYAISSSSSSQQDTRTTNMLTFTGQVGR